MASNTNKRVAVKHIRDGIKSQYPKGTQCEICGTDQDLEYHHYATLSIVFQEYCSANQIPVGTDEQVIAMRDKFYEDNWDAVVTDGVTLCNTHHKALHLLYGKQPALNTAKKQKHWVHRMLEKSTNGLQEGTDSQTSARFSKHIPRTRVDFATLI